MASLTEEVPKKSEQQKVVEASAIDWQNLVALVAKSEPAGIEALHHIFYRGLLVIFREFHDEAEDLAHEVLLDVVDAIRRDKILYPDRLCGFVRTVARRTAATRIGERIRSRACEASSDVVEITVDYRDTPEQQAIASEQAEIARKLLETLSPRDREVLCRFYVDGQSPAQICAVMGLSATQFRLLKSRAKSRLTAAARNHVAGKAPGEPRKGSSIPNECIQTRHAFVHT